MPLPVRPIRIAAIIPVGSLERAKSRLGESLDAEERHDLVERSLQRTIAAAVGSDALADVVVVSPDRDVRSLATAAGARTLRQRTSGLNPGLDEARDDVVAGGAEAVLVVPIDLPFVTSAALDAVLATMDGSAGPDGPLVTLVTDRHGTGTNALLLRPPDVIAFTFGIGSRAAHRTAALRAGATYLEVDGPLAIDLDTPEDLVLVQALTAEAHGAA